MYVRHENSSQIHSTSYSPDTQELFVKFLCPLCKGAAPEDPEKPCTKCAGEGASSHYRYANVDAAKYSRIRDAESVGRAFGAEIKSKPKEHPYERLS